MHPKDTLATSAIVYALVIRGYEHRHAGSIAAAIQIETGVQSHVPNSKSDATQLTGGFGDPLSTVSHDPEFTHLIPPYTLSYFRPHTASRQVGDVWWKHLSAEPRDSQCTFAGLHTRRRLHRRGSSASCSKT